MQTTYTFEECPTFHRGGFYAGMVAGAALIGFDDSGEWWINSLELECDNAKTGTEAKGRTIKLHREFDKELIGNIKEALENLHRDHISSQVLRELEAAGFTFQHNMNAEHRLSLRELV